MPESSDGELVQQPSEPTKSQPVNTGPVVNFSNNIDLLPGQPLPELDTGNLKAYNAVGREDKGGNLVVYVCEKAWVPRIYMAPVFEGIINSSLFQLVKHGPVYWPPAKQERYVFVYRHNAGKRVLMPGKKPAGGIRQDFVIDNFIIPLVAVLQDFRDRDFFHGTINPSNMFLEQGGEGAGKVVLGDCLTVPSGFFQPSLYETIERACMDPIGKGQGTQAEDIYAFGASIGVLLRSSDPLEGMTADQVIKHKIEHGSYSAITGKERFKGSLLELLRGALHDDPAQRWNIEEILSWLDGRRLTPKQSLLFKKASRPIEFMGKQYSQTAVLSMDLDKSPDETFKLVESGELEQWMTRAVTDTELAERVEEAYKVAGQNGTGPGYADKLVASLSLAMYGLSPMRYKGMRLGGGGVGTALAEAMILKKDVQVFANLFLQNIAMNWLNAQENPSVDVGALVNRYDSCRKYLQQDKMGFGLERCVYSLCPELHCLSDIFKDYLVTTSEEMVSAFEDLCAKGQAPERFFDRHSIAFLSVKDSKSVDPYLFDFSAKDDFRNRMAALKCLATIQKRSSLGPLPHIAKTFMERMSDIYKRFHDREIVETVDQSIKRFVREGDLVKMANLLDNKELLNRDHNNFRHAMIEYAKLQHEAKTLELRLENKSAYGRAAGREVSALIASVISCLIIIFFSLVFLAGKVSF